MTAKFENIEPQAEFSEVLNSDENGKEGIEVRQKPLERSSAVTGSETRSIVFESAMLDDEQDRAFAGQTGNWRSKVGILLPNMEKWNPSFRPPTIGRTGSVMWNLAKFYGPGAILSVAYIDPDNYQTDVSAGTESAFELLFMLPPPSWPLLCSSQARRQVSWLPWPVKSRWKEQCKYASNHSIGAW